MRLLEKEFPRAFYGGEGQGTELLWVFCASEVLEPEPLGAFCVSEEKEPGPEPQGPFCVSEEPGPGPEPLSAFCVSEESELGPEPLWAFCVSEERVLAVNKQVRLQTELWKEPKQGTSWMARLSAAPRRALPQGPWDSEGFWEVTWQGLQMVAAEQRRELWKWVAPLVLQWALLVWSSRV